MSKALNWEKDAKCYVLCEHIKKWDENKKSWYIRPCDMDADDLRRLWKSTKGFIVTFGGCVLSARDNECEEEFIIRATIAGKGPAFKDVNDEDNNSIDFIDLSTGESLDKIREVACKKLKTSKKRRKTTCDWTCD